ncbi:ATP-binding protein [Archaeoglobus sp.]
MQIAVVSGKGGTGKTTVTSVFATLCKGVIADCDVDAPNLHILLKPRILEEIPFKGMKKAKIIQEKCERCGLCMDLCRFDAIYIENDTYKVDIVRCEGCAFCFRACPNEAIEMVSEVRGKIFVSETEYGPFVHASLEPGEENSGLLVHEVKRKAEEVAEEKGLDLILVDGAPGIGCPVIASLSKVDKAVVVTEPTLSGLNDMERVLKLIRHFRIEPYVIINKFDLNLDVSNKIERFCNSEKIPIVAKIPFYEDIPKAIANLQIPVKDEIVEAWENLWR